MRHAYFGRKLGRDTTARLALLNSLASFLLAKGQIKTTLAKAKFVQAYTEKLITSAKRQKDLAKKRILASLLEKEAFEKLTSQIAPGFEKRNGGYTRIIRLIPRRGDSAPMARLELMPLEKKQETPKIANSKPQPETMKEAKEASAKKQ